MTFSNLFAREGTCHKAASAHTICSPTNFLLVLEHIATSPCMQYALIIIITNFPFCFRNLLQRIASSIPRLLFLGNQTVFSPSSFYASSIHSLFSKIHTVETPMLYLSQQLFCRRKRQFNQSQILKLHWKANLRTDKRYTSHNRNFWNQPQHGSVSET